MKNKNPFQLFGILGHPLLHTLSPHMQEAAFRAKKIPAFYLPLDLTAQNFLKFQRQITSSPFCGFNITVPYKQKILSSATVLSNQAKKIGAINTLVRKRTGWYGENTDVDGLICSLKKDADFSARGKKVLILGAGGAARAVVFAMGKSGAREICLSNRTLSKAKRVVRDFQKYFPKTIFSVVTLESEKIREKIQGAALIINATSLGLKTTDARVLQPSWIPAAQGKSRKVFFDLIYNPAVTPFLKAARNKGHCALNGLGMLLYQGVLSWEIWTGRRAPIGAMRQALKEGVKASL